MKRQTGIRNVHVDSISSCATKACAGFELGAYRYHVWFNPQTMMAEPTLYKNPIDEADRPRSRPYAIRLDPEAKTNLHLLAEMWEQIRERDLVRIAVQNDEAKRERNKREQEAQARLHAAREAAFYELGAIVDGEVITMLCDEPSARAMLERLRQITADDMSVYCLDLRTGTYVVAFCNEQPAEVVS